MDQLHGQEGQARIDVIVELCGRNNLPAFGNVIGYELKKLAAAKGYYRQPVCLSKDWFPEIEIDLSAFDMDTTMKVDAAKYQGTSRVQRRVSTMSAFDCDFTPPQCPKEWWCQLPASRAGEYGGVRDLALAGNFTA